MSILENRLALSEKQLVSKTDLYKRWEHATEEEIAELCEAEKLRAYAHLKGPINGITYCLPAYAWYDSFFHDEDVSYYSLEDVEACEKEYPDFIGIIQTPSNYEKKMGTDEGPYDKNDEPFDVSKSTPWDEVVFPLSLEGLVDRWQCEIDKIESLVKNGTLTAYDKKDWIPYNGNKVTRANKRPAVIGISGPQEDIIFNLDEISVFEETNPVFFKSIREYIPAEEVRVEINLSPTKFVEFLRKHYADIPIYGLLPNDRDFFYSEHTRLVEATVLLASTTIHHLDWETFQHRENRSLNRKDTALTEPIDSSNIEEQLSKVQLKATELSQQNKQLLAEKADLKKKLEEVQALMFKSKNVTSSMLDFNDEQRQDSPEAIIDLATLGDTETAMSFIAEKDARIAELEKQLAALPDPPTTVDAKKWRNSVEAAFCLWKEIIEEEKRGLKNEEFTERLKDKYYDYHTEVQILDSVVTSLLPIKKYI